MWHYIEQKLFEIPHHVSTRECQGLQVLSVPKGILCQMETKGQPREELFLLPNAKGHIR